MALVNGKGVIDKQKGGHEDCQRHLWPEDAQTSAMLVGLKVFLLLLPPLPLPLPFLEISLCSREGQGRGQVATDPGTADSVLGEQQPLFLL